MLNANGLSAGRFMYGHSDSQHKEAHLMRITFHGAAQEVTGSMHLIEVNDQTLLLDCGMYQGQRAETYERNLTFRSTRRPLTTVVLSHAHIDHSGNMPNLVKQGFDGNIWCTAATRNLSRLHAAG